MAAGPIGSVWNTGSWSDTSWTLHTWADVGTVTTTGPQRRRATIHVHVQGGSLRAVGDVVRTSTAGYASVGIRLSGLSGTVVVEGSVDGRTFGTLTVETLDGTSITSTTAAGQWRVSCEGLVAVQVRMSAYTSGTCDAFLMASGAVMAAAVVATDTGAIVSSTLGSAGVLYAPSDLGIVPSSLTDVTGGIYLVTAVTQSDTVLSYTLTTMTVAGNRTATYPALSQFRVYNTVDGGD